MTVMNKALRLHNHRILVTGASADSAIGMGICQELADQGAQLVLMGRRQAQLEETRERIAHSDRHSIEVMDLTALNEIADRLKLITTRGPLHGLVHSASFQGYSPLSRVNAQQFDQYFHLNVAAPLMLARGLRQKDVCPQGASMVLIGSVAGLRGQKGRSLYAASKAAMISLTQSLALELADKSIRVNCLAPAVIQGPRADEQLQLLTDSQRQLLFNAHPMGLGRAMDIAKAAAFLLSPDSGWITGTTLPVDGGYLAG
jgi:NAD(P)-dependent dehydrogenase (short-subunit alcohol dehydrogenase family)